MNYKTFFFMIPLEYISKLTFGICHGRNSSDCVIMTSPIVSEEQVRNVTTIQWPITTAITSSYHIVHGLISVFATNFPVQRPEIHFQKFLYSENTVCYLLKEQYRIILSGTSRQCYLKFGWDPKVNLLYHMVNIKLSLLSAGPIEMFSQLLKSYSWCQWDSCVCMISLQKVAWSSFEFKGLELNAQALLGLGLKVNKIILNFFFLSDSLRILEEVQLQCKFLVVKHTPDLMSQVVFIALELLNILLFSESVINYYLLVEHNT